MKGFHNASPTIGDAERLYCTSDDENGDEDGRGDGTTYVSGCTRN